MKNKKAKKSSRAKINAKLAKGAEKIKKAKKLEPIKIKESTRPIPEILKQRVEMLPGSVGVKIDQATPLEEHLRILDWATSMSDHVGFIIGDVLNFGHARYGEKYQRALNQTGRAYSTLAGYAEAARKIPASKRISALSFTHHRELLRAGPEKLDQLLRTLTKELKQGKMPTTAEVRERVKKLKPRGKNGKNGKAETDEPPYVPTGEEQAVADGTEEALKAIDVDKLAFLAKCDAPTQLRWSKLLTPFANLCDKLSE